MSSLISSTLPSSIGGCSFTNALCTTSFTQTHTTSSSGDPNVSDETNNAILNYREMCTRLNISLSVRAMQLRWCSAASTYRTCVIVVQYTFKAKSDSKWLKNYYFDSNMCTQKMMSDTYDKTLSSDLQGNVATRGEIIKQNKLLLFLIIIETRTSTPLAYYVIITDSMALVSKCYLTENVLMITDQGRDYGLGFVWSTIHHLPFLSLCWPVLGETWRNYRFPLNKTSMAVLNTWNFSIHQGSSGLTGIDQQHLWTPTALLWSFPHLMQ